MRLEFNENPSVSHVTEMGFSDMDRPSTIASQTKEKVVAYARLEKRDGSIVIEITGHWTIEHLEKIVEIAKDAVKGLADKDLASNVISVRAGTPKKKG